MNVDAWAPLVASLGDLRLALAGTVLAIAFLAYRGHFDFARLFIAGVALAVLVTVLAKLIGFALERWPIGALIGSPSGHTSVGTVFVGSVALVLSRSRSALGRVFILGCAALAIIVIAYSRIANSAHTSFEVLEGLVIGLVGLIPLAALRFRRKARDDSEAVPAWPLVLMIAALVALGAIVPMPDLDTESIVRLVAASLPVSHH